MLHLITGRSGSGKTEYLLRTLGALAQAGNDQLILLVPEQYSFDSERAILEHFGNRTGQNIQVLSFSRLADYVFRKLGLAGVTDPDDGTRIIFMLRAIHSVQDSLEYYTKHIDSVPLARQLVATAKEIHQAGAALDQLEQIAHTTDRPSFSRKLHDLALIFRTYEAMLAKSYPHADRSSELLCQKLDETLLLSGYTVAIDGFKSFTRQEMEIIRRLFRQSKDCFLSLCTPDPYGADPSMVFPAINNTAKRILRLAKEENVRVVIPKQQELGIQPGLRFHEKELAHLEANFFTPLEKPYEGGNRHVTIRSSQDLFEECRWIAATSRKLIRENGLRCKDIAVIVRHEEDYRFDLLSAFREYGIPVFDDSRQPVASQPLLVLCCSVLDLADSFSTEKFLRYLKTGLTPLSELECSRLENYILLWDLKGKEIREEFTKNPLGLGVPNDEKTVQRAEQELKELNKFRKTAVEPLKAFSRKAKRATFRDIGTALYQFLQDTGVPESLLNLASGYAQEGKIALAREQNDIWSLFTQILEQLASVYGDEVSTVQNYKNLFSAVVSVSTLGEIPQSLDEITIGSADRIRLNSPKVVFVSGCEEGIFPAAVSSPGLFTAQDRQELNKDGIELSLSDELIAAEERFTAYTAAAAASEQVFFTYHRVDTDGSALYPSPIIETVQSLFPDQNRQDAELDVGAFCPPEYFCETERSSFQTYAGLLRPQTEPDRETEFVVRTVLQNSRLEQDRIQALDRTAEQAPFHIENHKIAETLFGKNMQLSASRVDTYYRCPFQYFCKYGLNAKPRKPAKLDPAQSGTVVHYVLEHLLAETPIGRLTLLSNQDRLTAVHNAVDKWLSTYLDERMDGSEDKTLRFLYLYHQLALSLYDIVNRLCEEFSKSQFVPTDFELGIGTPDGLPAYSLSLNDGGSLHITGSIDRVDTYKKDDVTYVRVVDYKTGGKDFVLSDVLYGLNMQMLIYLFAIEAGGQKRYGVVKPAGVLYYQAKRNVISQHSRSGPSEFEVKDLLSRNCSSGLLLEDRNMLTAMEEDLKGTYIPARLKVTKKKGEELIGNLITARDMGLLRKRIDKILQEMAESLHRGEIQAVPAYNTTHYKNICDYCDYRAVCGFEDGEVREISKLDNPEVFTTLEDEEGGDLNE